MKCPYCGIGFSINQVRERITDKFPFTQDMYESGMAESEKNGYTISTVHCPDCKSLIVFLSLGTYISEEYGGYIENEEEQTIYPTYSLRIVSSEVPTEYKEEFLEACSVLELSPKSSAALNRRLLQRILREECNIKHRSLATEIDEFISRPDMPPYLTEAVDAVRNIGNFAAHPLKDTNTGEIVDVEAGEAEWLIEVIEALFEFIFVQPEKLKERRNKLNTKLAALNKPPMK